MRVNGKSSDEVRDFLGKKKKKKASGLADGLMVLWGRGGTMLHFTALT